jgi:hypothetical protein
MHENAIEYHQTQATYFREHGDEGQAAYHDLLVAHLTRLDAIMSERAQAAPHVRAPRDRHATLFWICLGLVAVLSVIAGVYAATS